MHSGHLSDVQINTLTKHSPGYLAKDEASKAKLADSLYNLAEAIRIVSILIQPFMTKAPALMHGNRSVLKTTQSRLGTVQRNGDFFLMTKG